MLCHGWPELAYAWRHQIRALADAGLRVIAPDQCGFGATSALLEAQAFDLEQLTADLQGLRDHLGIAKAIFVGHDWGGFVVWQMALRHPARVAGVISLNTPHLPRAPVDPIAILRSATLDPVVRVPALMIMAEHHAVLPPSAPDGMNRLVPDLEKVLVRDSGHCTQQEQPEVVSAKLIEWRRRRLG